MVDKKLRKVESVLSLGLDMRGMYPLILPCSAKGRTHHLISRSVYWREIRQSRMLFIEAQKLRIRLLAES